jgi:protein disulfide-isomerase A6
MKNSNSNPLSATSIMSNPLFIVVMLLLGLIIVLSIFKSITPFLNLSLGINAHIGDLKGSFEIEAFDNDNSDSQPKFIIYYAEWCGHCKRTMPEFEELMKNYKGNVKVVAIDAEALENVELVKAQQVKGYPTIRYYPTGMSGSFDEYSGERTYSDFVQYLGSVQGTPDRMPDQAAPF